MARERESAFSIENQILFAVVCEQEPFTKTSSCFHFFHVLFYALFFVYLLSFQVVETPFLENEYTQHSCSVQVSLNYYDLLDLIEFRRERER